ncbi:MAG: magnesium chelatase ATPase subunit I, partial [Pseudomonadota bacterium]
MAKAFPFTAIVGQEELKTALLIATVDPSIGGVLAFGDRGTGKSTAIRALAALMPKIPMVQGCGFNCDPKANEDALCEACIEATEPLKVRQEPIPVVDLPLGATEDRVLGALDLERALHDGQKSFEPGLLAKAHRGFLYIDEVNLLEDHIVDSLLDVAASGENLVEREGLSVRHPARFVLVGSGNPEEGELRPQLLDRFGLSVEVRTPQDVQQRVEVVRQRDAFDLDSDAFVKRYARKEGRVRKQIQQARDRLPGTEVASDLLERAARLCLELGTDGLRGELTLIRAARAKAALAGRESAALEDLRSVAPSVLRHRLRRDPLDESGSSVRIERALESLTATA